MRRLIVMILSVLIVAGCVTTRGTPDERRAAIREMRTDVLTELYRQKSSARAELAAAPGYGVFSNANVNVILASFGGGFGVVRNNATGADTFMKMGEIGVGLGAGVKDYRLVFVFHDAQTMQHFVDKGWAFGGQADAAAKAGEQGAARPSSTTSRSTSSPRADWRCRRPSRARNTGRTRRSTERGAPMAGIDTHAATDAFRAHRGRKLTLRSGT